MENSSYLNKWSTYSQKYGAVHAAVSFVGRSFPSVWNLLGPAVSGSYRQRWLKEHQGKRILNLGGGGNVSSEWLTGDIDPRADTYCDLTKPLPFDGDSIDGILLEEVIEHIDYAAGRALLLECHRVLRPGGHVRVSTPSLEWITGLWLRRQPLPEGLVTEQAEQVLEPHPHESTALNVAAINATFYGHGHRFIYDEAVLGGQLSAAGFLEIEFGTYKDAGAQLGRLDSHPERFSHPPELSLYVEACKPARPASSTENFDKIARRTRESASFAERGSKVRV
jgi:predicted SAM-dependent methyltransferase